MILPFESSPKVTVPLSWYLDTVAKLLISQIMCLEQPLSKYHRSLRHVALVCTLTVFSFVMKHTLAVSTSSSESLSESHVAFKTFFLYGFLEVKGLLLVSGHSATMCPAFYNCSKQFFCPPSLTIFFGCWTWSYCTSFLHSSQGGVDTLKRQIFRQHFNRSKRCLNLSTFTKDE